MLQKRYFNQSSGLIVSLEDSTDGDLVYSEEGFLKSLRTSIFGLNDKEHFLTLYFQIQKAKTIEEFKENMKDFSDAILNKGSDFEKFDTALAVNGAKLRSIFAKYSNRPIEEVAKEKTKIVACLNEVDKLFIHLDNMQTECLKKGNFSVDQRTFDFLEKEHWDKSKVKANQVQIVKDNDAQELIKLTNTARAEFRKYHPSVFEALTFQYRPFNPRVFPYNYLQAPNIAALKEPRELIIKIQKDYPKMGNSIFSFVF